MRRQDAVFDRLASLDGEIAMELEHRVVRFHRVARIDLDLVILLRPFDLRELGGAGVLLTSDRGFLLGGIDLHQRSPGRDAFAGVDEDLRDDAFDLRHDQGGVAGLQGGDVVGGVVNFLGLGGLDFDRHGLRWGSLGSLAVAATGREKERGQKDWGRCQERRYCRKSRHNRYAQRHFSVHGHVVPEPKRDSASEAALRTHRRSRPGTG